MFETHQDHECLCRTLLRVPSLFFILRHSDLFRVSGLRLRIVLRFVHQIIEPRFQVRRVLLEIIADTLAIHPGFDQFDHSIWSRRRLATSFM